LGSWVEAYLLPAVPESFHSAISVAAISISCSHYLAGAE